MMETTALADGTAVPHTANPAAAPGSRLRRAIRGVLSGIDAPGGLVDEILAGRGLGATLLRPCRRLRRDQAAAGPAADLRPHRGAVMAGRRPPRPAVALRPRRRADVPGTLRRRPAARLAGASWRPVQPCGSGPRRDGTNRAQPALPHAHHLRRRLRPRRDPHLVADHV